TPAAPSAPSAPAAKPAPVSPPPAAAPAAKPAPAAGPSAPAAKPAAAAPAAKPAPVAEAPKSDKPGDPKAKEGGEGFKYTPGATFGTVTMNGQTWTRLSFTPEISVGKLGVGFNVELFLDQNQNLSTRGWDFDTRRAGTESVLRKIDYVRWDKPGAPFYARLGTLEGINLGYGLVSANYGNKARYPDYKELGLDLQLNDLTGFGVDLEGIVGNLEDLGNKGPVTAFKAGLRPLKIVGIPVLKDLAVRAGVAYDWNQYAGLRDADNDGCPDGVDKAQTNAATCVGALIQPNLPFVPASVYASADSAERAASDSMRQGYAVRKPFGVYWAEASLPIIETKFFGLELHSAIAKPKIVDPDAFEAGWGAIPLGAGSHIGPITLTAEYRAYSLPFQPDYFNATYSIERAKFDGEKIVTKEMEVYGDSSQKGMVQGYFAGAGWDAFGFLALKGSYTEMFASDSGVDNLKTLHGSVGIGPQVVSLMQQKVSLAEIYWEKDRIGQDKWIDTNGVSRKDSFLGKSKYLVFGYRVGSQVAPGLTLIVDRQTSFTRQANGSLKRDNQMRIESQMKF
ncbi:MAG: FecR protein, partial [Fibrobacterota bacterium]